MSSDAHAAPDCLPLVAPPAEFVVALSLAAHCYFTMIQRYFDTLYWDIWLYQITLILYIGRTQAALLPLEKRSCRFFALY